MAKEIQAGFLTGVVSLAVVTAAAVMVHLAYANVVLRTPSLHRLPGYARIYWGEGGGWVARFSHSLGLAGALLAYVVLGGHFIGALIAAAYPAASYFWGPLTFYLLGVTIIFWDIRFESLTNAILTVGLIFSIIVLAFFLLPRISLSSFTGFQIERLVLPYGVLLFAMAGAAVIPDMTNLLAKNNSRRLKKMVIAGTVIPALIYLIFAFFIVGATGGQTTPDAIGGLAGRFGRGYLTAGTVIGFLATITSFVPLGLTLKGMLVSDFGMRARPAWLAAALTPGVLYLLGFHDFIAIISIVGAVAIGIDSILILMLERETALKRRAGGFRLFRHKEARFLLIFVFVAGIAYELNAILR
ncbi:MAG: hypothetical protein HYT42_00820 [Candidatus Sungbacteria bacterium]|nr:hypothetical protein [Candidatus Sungbacteria bacterium]